MLTVFGGNHSLTVFAAAGGLDLPATVHAPENMPEGKARRAIDAGTKASASPVANTDSGIPCLHPFAEPDVIVGQVTITAEIVANIPEGDAPDSLAVYW